MSDIWTKPFDEIGKPDVDVLVTNAEPEGRRLEYKESLPGGSDAEKREFDADVSSFANASGGTILYGIVEQRSPSGAATGVPAVARGLANLNPDQELQRLEGIAIGGISPRIPGLRLKAVAGFPDGPVIVVRVPRSWRAPHMVSYQHSSRFYSRTSSGKYQLDVDEIRNAFRASESVSVQVRRLRDDRLARIEDGETPVPLSRNGMLLAMHCVPVSALDGQSQVDIRDVEARWRSLVPFGGPAPSYRINFDGLITHDASHKPARTYAQIDRTGVIEAVADTAGVVAGDKIFGHYVESAVIEEVPHALALYRHLNIDAPVVVTVTAMNVNGLFVALRDEMQHFMHGRSQAIDRPVLRLPEVLFDDLDADPAAVLRPSFDTLWQAAGWGASPSYDQNGRWTPPPK